MDLLQLKETTQKTWAELSAACGVPRSNLCLIARGRRGFGSDTGARLRMIGVDLNAQIDVLVSVRGRPPLPDDDDGNGT